MIDLLKCSFSRNSKFGHIKIVVVGLLANYYYRKRDLLYFEELIIRHLSLAQSHFKIKMDILSGERQVVRIMLILIDSAWIGKMYESEGVTCK